MAKPTPRTRVFVSYSHKDRKWLERLKVHINPLVRDGAIALWDDNQIAAGADWRSVIEAELSSARVAILLVSADFMASDFIANEELPALLRAAETDGTLIVPLIVSPSRFTHSVLSRFTAINAPNDPLIAMNIPKREDTFVRLAAVVHQAASSEAVEDFSETDMTDDAGPRRRLDVEATPTSPPSVRQYDPRRSAAAGDLVAGASLSSERHDTLLYDSDSERSPFSGWIQYAPKDATHWPSRENYEGTESMLLRATGGESIGINKSLPVLSGAVAFEYQVVEPRANGWHIYFAMIPMRRSQRGLLEVGAGFPVDPRNERSPYRIRVFVPGDQYGDGRWHAGHMAFDFHGLPTASYSIFAPRINEGVDEPKAAAVLVRSVRAWGAKAAAP